MMATTLCTRQKSHVTTGTLCYDGDVMDRRTSDDDGSDVMLWQGTATATMRQCDDDSDEECEVDRKLRQRTMTEKYAGVLCNYDGARNLGVLEFARKVMETLDLDRELRHTKRRCETLRSWALRRSTLCLSWRWCVVRGCDAGR
jgi:hypothetical protein